MLTRSEIFSNAKKATRGAGFSWGMAEEAATATVALYCVGQDGFAALIPILKNADGKPHPLSIETTPVCGLTLGTYLADCAKPVAQGDVIGEQIMHALCGSLPEGTPNFPHSIPKQIQDFAFRTYVPDSAESRRRGAG
tara:strand:+ start:5982 stop:6395 length:414 start_codon:yes stop_codon:yes gene_type:complete